MNNSCTGICRYVADHEAVTELCFLRRNIILTESAFLWFRICFILVYDAFLALEGSASIFSSNRLPPTAFVLNYVTLFILAFPILVSRPVPLVPRISVSLYVFLDIVFLTLSLNFDLIPTVSLCPGDHKTEWHENLAFLLSRKVVWPNRLRLWIVWHVTKPRASYAVILVYRTGD